MPAKFINHFKLTKPSFTGLFNKFAHLSKIKGFTLIELLIVVAIIGILSTIVLANYNSFGTRQEVKNAASELKSELRKYQTFALAGQKRPDPSNLDCDDTTKTLNFYSIEIDTTNNRYRAVLDCTTDTVNLPYASIPSGITMASSCANMQVRFKPINESVELTCGGASVSSIYTQLTSGSVSYRVYITESGEIYDERQP